MLHRVIQLLTGVVTVGIVASASGAQGTEVPPKSDKVEVPRGLRPPAGMCRVWIDNVPPGRQPAPTDCATAIRNRPPNARVIFSEDASRGAKARADLRSEPKSEPRPEPKDDRKKGKKPPRSS